MVLELEWNQFMDKKFSTEEDKKVEKNYQFKKTNIMKHHEFEKEFKLMDSKFISDHLTFLYRANPVLKIGIRLTKKKVKKAVTRHMYARIIKEEIRINECFS